VKNKKMRALALRWLVPVIALAAAGCAAPERPQRATLYDFGPGTAAAPASAATQSTIVLADLEASSGLDSSALLYRLGYADAHQLHPYARSRWSSPPLQLIRQRLREQLGRDRAVLDPSESAALARVGGAMPRVLRIDVEEFTHLFESPSQSWGVLRLRASLFETTPSGERLLAQRSFAARQPARTPDASGGVRALAAATDASADDLRQWLAATR
jgi:cholesterol transport system auxiliary component